MPGLGLLSPNRYQSDLSNEVLYALVGQEAAKISEIKKDLPDQPGPGRISLESGWVGNFLSTSNFDLWYFCSLLTYKSVKYLIWKIWFISVWRLKTRAMAWLIRSFMLAQSTLISYHMEAFVKTEVGCTVTPISNRLYYMPPIKFKRIEFWSHAPHLKHSATQRKCHITRWQKVFYYSN